MNKLLLILVFIFGAVSSAGGLQKGDLVFLSMPCQACQLIEETTGSPFSLVGILDPDPSGRLNVIMAGEPSVGEISLGTLVEHARAPAVYMRMNTALGQAWAMKATDVARQFIGTPYNPNFAWGTDSLYCSELIYFSFFIASGRTQSPFQVQAMHFEPYSSQWADLLGHSPPEGQPGLSPKDISESRYLEKIP